MKTWNAIHAIAPSTGDDLWTYVDDGFPFGETYGEGLSEPFVWLDGDEVAALATRYQGGGYSDREVVRLAAGSGASEGTIDITGLGSSTSHITQRGAQLATSGYLHNIDGNTFVEVDIHDRATGSTWGGYTGDVFGVPTLGRSRLYIAGRNIGSVAGGDDHDHEVVAFDTSTQCPPLPQAPQVDACVPIWRAALDGVVQPVVIGEDPSVLFVGTSAGTLVALDAATGATRWTATVGSPISQPPALAKGMLYVPTDAGELVAVPAGGCGAPTCPAAWRGTASGPITAQPAVAGGVVYAGASDGVVTAFPAASPGGATWSPAWTSPAPSAGGGSVKGLAISTGSLYVSRDGGVARYAP